MSDFAEEILNSIIEGLKEIDAEELVEVFDGDLGERFSCVIGQTYLLDVIAVNPHTSNIEFVIDIHKRPGTYNIHENMTQGTSERKAYAVTTFHDAMMRIMSAVVHHTSPAI